MLIDGEITCTACGREVEADARWCGGCGERLADAVAVEDVDTRAPVIEATVAASLFNSGDAGPSAEHDHPEPVVVEHRRRWPVVAVAMVVLLAAVVVFRPRPTPLHGAAPIGWGDAEGRDLARTGRIDADPIDAPTVMTWTIGEPSGFLSARARPFEDVVVVEHQSDLLQVLDGSDGGLLWEAEGYRVEEVGERLLLQGFGGASTLRDRRTGDVIWQRLLPDFAHIDVVQGMLFELEGGFPQDATRPEGATHRLATIDPANGQIVWEGFFGHDDLYVRAVTTEWVVLGDLSGVDESHDGTTLAHAFMAIDRATGMRTVRLDVPENPWAFIMLDDQTAVILVDGEASRVDLATGRRGARIPELDGVDLRDSGDIVIVGVDGGGSRVLDRASLAPLWESEVNLHLSRNPDEVVALDAEGGFDDTLEYRSSRTGELLHISSEDPSRFLTWRGPSSEISVDSNGRVVSRSLEGEVQWSRSLAEDLGPSSVRRAGAMLAVSIAGEQNDAWMGVTPGGGDIAVSFPPDRVPGAGRGLMTVAGDRVVATRNGISAYDVEEGEVAFRWSMPSTGVAAFAASPSTVWAAETSALRALAAESGGELSQSPVSAHWLSAAGDQALFALACQEELHGQCDAIAWRMDPLTLEPTWQSAMVERVCGGATLAGTVIAVPTSDEVVFLSARDGQEVGHWPVDRERCPEISFDGDQFVVATDDGLLVGKFGRTPSMIAPDAPVTTAPVIIGKQVIVGIDSGLLVAIDLDTREVQWSYDLVDAVATTVTVDEGSILVVTADGRLIRLD